MSALQAIAQLVERAESAHHIDAYRAGYQAGYNGEQFKPIGHLETWAQGYGDGCFDKVSDIQQRELSDGFRL